MPFPCRRERHPMTETDTAHIGDQADEQDGGARNEGARKGLAVGLVIAVAAAAGIGGYLLGESDGADLDSAQRQGRAQGAEKGRAVGLKAGYATGFKQAKRAAYELAHAASYKEACRSEF